MGRFYGSIHIRGDSPGRVEAVLRDVAQRLRLALYLSPHASASWLAIFPSDRGQDLAMSAALAERLTSTLVHVLVHDSDVFAYAIYRNSEKVDEFSSNADYFAHALPAERKRLRGNPSRYAELIRPESSIDDVEQILAAARAVGSTRANLVRPGERLEGVMAAADRETDELVQRAKPLKTRADAELRAQARDLFGIQEEDIAALTLRLVRHENPDARALVEEHGRQLMAILQNAAQPDGVLSRIRAPLASVDEQFAAFLTALGIPNADLSFEDIESDEVLASGMIRIPSRQR